VVAVSFWGGGKRLDISQRIAVIDHNQGKHRTGTRLCEEERAMSHI
jgi:hypothetical protein